MTDEPLSLAELLAKAGDSDFLRSLAEAVLQLLMETDVEGVIGAGRHERTLERATYRNGYRDRALDTRLGSLQLRIQKLRQGRYFPPFLDPPLPFHVLRTRNLGQLRPGRPRRRPWWR